MEDQGSFWSGWALGFLLGLIGLVIAISINKPETKRGSWWGFGIQAVIGLVLYFFAY